MSFLSYNDEASLLSAFLKEGEGKSVIVGGVCRGGVALWHRMVVQSGLGSMEQGLGTYDMCFCGEKPTLSTMVFITTYFLASHVVMENLAELGDKSQKVTGNC